MQNNIANNNSKYILNPTRKLFDPKAKDTNAISIHTDSDKIKEKESLIALARTDNCGTVFRTLADGHNLFQGRQIIKVWTWGKDCGSNEYPDMTLPLLVSVIGMIRDPGRNKGS
jgi:hypothetical protein